MVIAVDFDGTIVEHAYPKVGKPIPFAIDVLKTLVEEGNLLILWTVREGPLLDEAVAYCENLGLKLYAVNKNHPEELPGGAPRKLHADIFIDDRNLGGLPDWGLIYRIIKTYEQGIPVFGEWIEPYEEKKIVKKNFFIRLGEALNRTKGRRY